ncbi:hypothetical protein OBK22_08535 [Empedobacter falsenii]
MKYSIIFTFLFVITSCNQKPDCKFSAKLNSKSECTIIVNKLPSTVFFDAKGTDPINKKECKCSEGDRWWTQYKNEIEIGDTIIKRKGELTFNIHKKDTIISHEWECNGNTYHPNGTIKKHLN